MIKKIVLSVLLSFFILLQQSIQAQVKSIENGGMNPNLSFSIGKETQDFVELIDVLQERNRLGLRHFYWADFVPTGFYIKAGETLVINASNTKGHTLPSVIIGTYNYNDEKKPEITKLVAGENKIKTVKGGLIWIRYTHEKPTSTAKLSFKSGYVKAPIFIKGIDNSNTWKNQLSIAKCPDVLVLGNRVMQVYSLDYAKKIQNEDLNFVLQTADNIWDWQNEISGLDGSSEIHKLPVHNRILMVASPKTSIGGAYASYYGTAYGESALSGAFTKEIANEGWGTWHELGHEHQQLNWTNDLLSEVTVNIYSLHIERKLDIKKGRLIKEGKYIAALNFIKNKDPKKDFTSMTNSYNDHFTRLVMFQQLYLAFGEKFYPAIHKKARLEIRNEHMTDVEKLKWFAKTACKVSGENLSTFFKNWGFQLGENFYKEINDLGLPMPKVEPSTLHEMTLERNITENTPYLIISAASGSHSFDLNQEITLYSTHNGKNQHWFFKRTGDGYFQIFGSWGENYVLEIKNNAKSVGSTLNLGVNKNEDHQKWQIEINSESHIKISPKSAPDLYIDLSKDNIENGVKPVLNKKINRIQQKFYLQKAV